MSGAARRRLAPAPRTAPGRRHRGCDHRPAFKVADGRSTSAVFATKAQVRRKWQAWRLVWWSCASSDMVRPADAGQRRGAAFPAAPVAQPRDGGSACAPARARRLAGPAAALEGGPDRGAHGAARSASRRRCRPDADDWRVWDFRKVSVRGSFRHDLEQRFGAYHGRRPVRPAHPHALGPARWRRRPGRSRLGSGRPRGDREPAPGRGRGPGPGHRHRPLPGGRPARVVHARQSAPRPDLVLVRSGGAGPDGRASGCCRSWSRRTRPPTRAVCRSAARPGSNCRTTICNTRSPGTAWRRPWSRSTSPSASKTPGRDDGAAPDRRGRDRADLRPDRARRLGARDRLGPLLSRLADLLRPLAAAARHDPGRGRLQLRPGALGMGPSAGRGRHSGALVW